MPASSLHRGQTGNRCGSRTGWNRCPQGSLSAEISRLTAILTAALTAALDLPVRSVRCRRRLLVSAESGVVEQRSHVGTVSQPSDSGGCEPLLRGRPRGVSSQAPELRERKIGITPFDCPRDNFGHGFWTPLAVLAVGEWRLLQKRWRSQWVVASPPQ
jgi:hypothetical protein